VYAGQLAFETTRVDASKLKRPRTVWLGVALMLYPYAISRTWLLYAVGLALCAGVALDRD